MHFVLSRFFDQVICTLFYLGEVTVYYQLANLKKNYERLSVCLQINPDFYVKTGLCYYQNIIKVCSQAQYLSLYHLQSTRNAMVPKQLISVALTMTQLSYSVYH